MGREVKIYYHDGEECVPIFKLEGVYYGITIKRRGARDARYLMRLDAILNGNKLSEDIEPLYTAEEFKAILVKYNLQDRLDELSWNMGYLFSKPIRIEYINISKAYFVLSNL